MGMGGRVTAVLGPTNTGKTHYAIERMLAHRTGVIGLPLRLLAREVYDRIVVARGPVIISRAELAYDASVNDGAKITTKLGQLAAVGIIARDGV